MYVDRPRATLRRPRGRGKQRCVVGKRETGHRFAVRVESIRDRTGGGVEDHDLVVAAVDDRVSVILARECGHRVAAVDGGEERAGGVEASYGVVISNK